MSIKIRIKMCSDRGASFSMALLLLLVCTVVSSIVLAASTAMVGVVTQQGKSDQRYFSVTSATGLLTNWMGVDNEVQVNAMQTRSLGEGADVHVSAELDADSIHGDAFDEVLTVATKYALFGTPVDAEAETELIGLDEDEWLEPFTYGVWDQSAFPIDSLPLTATVEPDTSTIGSGSKQFNLQVEVEGVLTPDWVLYLVFKNTLGAGEDATDQYQVLVTLHGNVDSFPRDNESENKLGLESIVTWKLAGIEPGKGMPLPS